MVIWRTILGFEGLYSVSDAGGVRRDAPSRGFGGRARPGEQMRQKASANGYRSVSLYPPSGKQRTLLVHRLVAAAFIGSCPAGRVVNHRDGHKANNALSNLEYVTPAENIRHAYATGLAKGRKGESNSMATLNAEAVTAIRILANEHNWSVAAIARAFRVDTSRVHRILDGSLWASEHYIPAW